jgi:hypothetical protein
MSVENVCTVRKLSVTRGAVNVGYGRGIEVDSQLRGGDQRVGGQPVGSLLALLGYRRHKNAKKLHK